jgi:hypothetical protein
MKGTEAGPALFEKNGILLRNYSSPVNSSSSRSGGTFQAQASSLCFGVKFARSLSEGC